MMKNIEDKIRENTLLQKVRNAYTNLKGACSECHYSKEMQVCYGCRGNALSYNKEENDVLNEDPMCFGVTAVKFGKEKLSKFMSQKHIRKIYEYFPM